MRSFWHFVALLLLLAFLPATTHCMGASRLVHMEDAAACASECHHEGEGKEQTPGAPTRSDHDCPTETLAKTNVPAPLMVPALPCQELDATLAAMLRLVAEENLDAPSMELRLERNTPKEWIHTWVFVSRAALSPRSPSALA
jgi:hypothetical protein